MCSRSSAPRPTPPPAQPIQRSAAMVDEDAETERDRRMRRERARGGRQSTILASAAQNYAAPTGQQKTALGT